MFSELPNHIHSSLVEQILLDLWSKPGMIALIKEEKKAPSVDPVNKAVIPLSDSTDIQYSVEAQVVGWFQ